MEEESPEFQKDIYFWEREINGNMARTNDAAANMEVAVVLPTAIDHILSKEKKIESIKDFQFELRRLYKNSLQILDSNGEETKKKLEAWFEATNGSVDFINQELLKEGIKLNNELQSFLREQRRPINWYPFKKMCEMYGLCDLNE